MSRQHSRLIAVIVAVIGLALGSETANAQNYLTDLGPYAPGLGINNSGQVVLQNYLYSSGTLTAFPANFVGAGINSIGQVAGSVGLNCQIIGEDRGLGCAFATYASGVLTTYPIYQGSLDPAVGNQAQSMNASGEIVGDWVFTHGEGYPLVLTNGVFSALQFPGSTCGGNVATEAGVAYAINDAGQIAGLLPYQTAGAQGGCAGHAFLFSNGAYYDIGIGSASALNASGEVTGSLQFGNSSAAFLYSAGGTPMNLGTLPGNVFSTGYGINSAALVVGTSESTGNPATNVNHAFFYNGVMNDLNTFVLPTDPLQPYVKLTDARGINDSGLVVVNGVDSRDKSNHAYLLQVPLIQVTPGPLTFASQAINTMSPPQTVTFTNVGTTSIALGVASVTRGFNTPTNNCNNSSLAPSAGCDITVAYSPTTAGNPTGGLTLIAAGVPIVVPLSGASALSASISASAATVITGTPVTLTWTASPGATCTATGGSAADGWTGSVSASGSKAVTESTAGTYSYGLACTAGSQTQSPSAPVVVTWPAVTVMLSASPTTIIAGHSTTLTWKAANATTCTASGGGPSDAWPGAKATSGTATVTEPYAIDTPSVTLTYTLACTSSASKLSGQASANVTEVQAPSASSGSGGGGGAFDSLSLIFLFALRGLHQLRRNGVKMIKSQ